jgi:hypothetical protein
MSAPGTRLRAIAERLCRPGTIERLVDPALADLRLEYEDALRHGGIRQRYWVLFRGYLAFFTMAIVHGGRRALGFVHTVSDEDRRGLIRTCAVAIAITTLGSLALAAAPLLRILSSDHPDIGRLAINLIPQTLPLSLPVGLTFGILFGPRLAASSRSRVLILLIAIVWSLASFTTLGWIIPAGNQNFRTAIAGRPVAKAPNELTVRELGRSLEQKRTEPTSAVRSPDLARLKLEYHTRWALACAPVVLALLAMASTSRRQRGSLVRALTGCAAVLGYFALMVVARAYWRDGGLPAFAAAWAPNIGLLTVAVAASGFPVARRPPEAHDPHRDREPTAQDQRD